MSKNPMKVEGVKFQGSNLDGVKKHSSSDNPDASHSGPDWFIIHIKRASRPSGIANSISIPTWLPEPIFQRQFRKALSFHADALKGVLKDGDD